VSEVLLLGISHKTAPVAVRERLAFTDAQLPGFLGELLTAPSIREAVAISTCNRTEVYLVVTDAVEAESAALGALAARAGIRPTELADVVYAPRNCDAARQLFRVSAGLESMIVGESEVQGQVRRAHEMAIEAGTDGPLANRLFNAALKTGGRVRAETAIGAGGASISSVAVDLAVDVLGDLAERHVVIIGAGETAELTARALAAKGVTTIFVANRRAARARWPSASAARSCRSTACPTSSSTPTWSSPPPRRPTRSSAPRSWPRSCAPAAGGRCCCSTSRSRATSSTRAATWTA
jgi:glutamyl-tRNA reductase